MYTRLLYLGCMENRIAIGLKLPPALVRRLDAQLNEMEFPPSRTLVIERLIEDWVAQRETAAKKGGRK